MPGPTRSQIRLTRQKFRFHVRITDPGKRPWCALDCYYAWLADRYLPRVQEHYANWTDGSYGQEMAVFGFLTAADASAFEAFAISLIGMSDAEMRATAERLRASAAPRTMRAHST